MLYFDIAVTPERAKMNAEDIRIPYTGQTTAHEVNNRKNFSSVKIEIGHVSELVQMFNHEKL